MRRSSTCEPNRLAEAQDAFSPCLSRCDRFQMALHCVQPIPVFPEPPGIAKMVEATFVDAPRCRVFRRKIVECCEFRLDWRSVS